MAMNLVDRTHRTHAIIERDHLTRDPRFGAAVISFGLPLVCYAFAFLCNDVSGCPAPSLLHPYSFDLDQLKRDVAWPGFGGLVNIKAFVGMLAYYASSLVFYAILPAQEVEGVELSGGGRLKYRLNGESQIASIVRVSRAVLTRSLI